MLLLIVAREVETIEDIAEGVATVHLFYLPEIFEVLIAVGSIIKLTSNSGRRLATCYAHLVVGRSRRVAHGQHVVIDLLAARFALDDVDATIRYTEFAFEGGECSVELSHDVVDLL